MSSQITDEMLAASPQLGRGAIYRRPTDQDDRT